MSSETITRMITTITSATEDIGYNYTPTTNDVDIGDSVTISLTTGPSWLILNAGNLGGIPRNSDVGTHSVVLTATDLNGGTATQSFTITVVNTNDAPTITSSANVFVLGGCCNLLVVPALYTNLHATPQANPDTKESKACHSRSTTNSKISKSMLISRICHNQSKRTCRIDEINKMSLICRLCKYRNSRVSTISRTIRANRTSRIRIIC